MMALHHAMDDADRELHHTEHHKRPAVHGAHGRRNANQESQPFNNKIYAPTTFGHGKNIA